MKNALLLCCLLLAARSVLAGETETIQAPSPITAIATPDPTWNFELTTAFTGTARIMKAGSFGSQAGRKHEMQAFRDIKLFQNSILQLRVHRACFKFSRSGRTCR